MGLSSPWSVCERDRKIERDPEIKRERTLSSKIDQTIEIKSMTLQC